MREAKERERELKYKLENKIKLEKTFPLSRSIKSYSIPLIFHLSTISKTRSSVAELSN